MLGFVKISSKLQRIQEADDRLNNIGLDAGEFSEAPIRRSQN